MAVESQSICDRLSASERDPSAPVVYPDETSVNKRTSSRMTRVGVPRRYQIHAPLPSDGRAQRSRPGPVPKHAPYIMRTAGRAETGIRLFERNHMARVSRPERCYGPNASGCSVTSGSPLIRTPPPDEVKTFNRDIAISILDADLFLFIRGSSHEQRRFPGTTVAYDVRVDHAAAAATHPWTFVAPTAAGLGCHGAANLNPRIPIARVAGHTR